MKLPKIKPCQIRIIKNTFWAFDTVDEVILLLNFIREMSEELEKQNSEIARISQELKVLQTLETFTDKK